MFNTAEPLMDLDQEVERKQSFSPPFQSWYIINLVLASHQEPTNGVPSKVAGRKQRMHWDGRVGITVRGDGQG